MSLGITRLCIGCTRAAQRVLTCRCLNSFIICVVVAHIAGLVSSRAFGQTPRVSTLFATVSEDSTGRPLSSAEVVLPDLHRTGRANWLGEVVLDSVPRGRQRVRVRVFGYAPADVPIVFSGDTVGVSFVLQPLARMLDTLRVTAARVPRRLQEFDWRRRIGVGRYLTDRQLDSVASRDFQTVMTERFPGLQVISIGTGRRILASTRGGCGGDPSRLVNQYGGKGSSGGGSGCQNSAPCPVIVYLDGADQGEADLDILRTWDLAGIEYYSGSQVPVQYRISGASCGVMLLWSRD